MQKTTRITAFTGNFAIETAISERIEYTGDYIDENELTMPDGSTPPDGWPCAIFRPEAGMYGYDLDSGSSGTLSDERSCAAYGLPKGTGSAVFLALKGEAREIERFCQAVCDKSGMDCHLFLDSKNGYIIEKSIRGAGAPMDTESFIGLLFDEPEWEF